MTVVTMSEARAALRATVAQGRMTDEEIDALADYLISFFGFGSEVIDNRLDVDDRDVFYMLEEAGLLTTRQEEVHIKKGKLWRIHYWCLRVDRIKALAHDAGVPTEGGLFAVYDKIPDDVWMRKVPAK